eukprot:6173664-Pleurochrysis_carterae.AAC.1
MREGTWKQIRADARSQRLQADAEWKSAGQDVGKEFSTAAKEIHVSVFMRTLPGFHRRLLTGGCGGCRSRIKCRMR